jgi:tetratricopeptide (TPR) repeat protein
VAAAVVLLVGGTALATWAHRGSAELLIYRGQQAIEEEAWAEAATQFEAALVADQDVADAALYFYLGVARNQLDEHRSAAQAYERALALAPDDSATHWNLALTYLELARYDLAREHFEAYLRLNPEREAEVRPYLNQLDHLP